MTSRSIVVAAIASLCMFAPIAHGQINDATDSDGGDTQSPLTQEGVLNSERWHRMQRSFDDWLSVQKIYNDDEVAQLKKGLRQRVDTLSAAELIDFLYDTEQRLAVLMSDEAMDARHFLSFFNEEARRQRIAPDGEVPDFFGMTVSQLRQELREFQQRRAERSAAQQTFNRAQTRQARDVARQQREQQARREQANRQARARQARQQTQQIRRPYPQGIRSRYIPRRDPLVTSEMFARREVLRGLWGF